MKHELMIVIIVIIVMTGCAKTDTPQKEPELIEYHTGSSGLEMKFLDQSPPEEVWELSKFPISIKIENKGAYDVDDGILYINYDQQTLQLSNNLIELQRPLHGKSQFYPEGERQIIDISADHFKSLQKREKSDKTVISANLCYTYTTEATAELCINPARFTHTEVEQGICDPSKSISLGSQGAPVAVTSIEQHTVPREYGEFGIKFKIDIENVGKGEVRKNTAYYKECNIGISQPLVEKEKGVIQIDEIAFSDYSTSDDAFNKIACRPNEEEIKLEDGKASILCTAILEKERGSYTTPLSVRLSYGYVSSESESVKIKKFE
ncbi:hypothetical protein GF336_06720 [Candidatus Woesearchaeota archaeon]|nr:hypothetical protein [Candidatus Woesearchaeota archaeon]